MIFSKLWKAFKAQLNKISNKAWSADPIAQMQYEYDRSVDELREGRVGLEQYRALVERVTRQVATDKAQVNNLDARVRAFLGNNDRETAAKFALEMNKAKQELTENEGQLKLHEEAYGNNLMKVKHATGKLAEVRRKIQKYDADLKMSRAEAEMAKVSEGLNLDITTDFGQIEQVIQDKIAVNRGRARVAADLSGQGLVEIEKERAMESAMAENALKEFEIELGLVTPQTSAVAAETKELGPSRETQTATQ